MAHATQISRSALLMVPVEVAYEVVVDVASYPEFLPACLATTIIETQSQGLTASVTVGGRVAGRAIEETFVTRNAHVLNEQIDMSLSDGPFEKLEGKWLFKKLGDQGCKIEVTINYTPKGLLARMLSTLVDPMASKMVDAFSQRIELAASRRLG